MPVNIPLGFDRIIKKAWTISWQRAKKNYRRKDQKDEMR